MAQKAEDIAALNDVLGQISDKMHKQGSMVINDQLLPLAENFLDDIEVILKNKSFLKLLPEKQEKLKKILQICEARIIFNDIVSKFYLHAPMDILLKRYKKQSPASADLVEDRIGPVIGSLRTKLSQSAKNDEKLYRVIVNLLRIAIAEPQKEAQCLNFDNLLIEIIQTMELSKGHRDKAIAAAKYRFPNDKNVILAIEASFKEEMELGSLEEIWGLMSAVVDKQVLKRRAFVEQFLCRNTSYYSSKVNVYDNYFIYLKEKIKPLIQQIQNQLDLIPLSTYKTGVARQNELYKLRRLKEALKVLEERVKSLQALKGKIVFNPNQTLCEVYDLCQKVISEYKKHAQLIQNYVNQPVLVFEAECEDERSDAKTDAEKKATVEVPPVAVTSDSPSTEVIASTNETSISSASATGSELTSTDKQLVSQLGSSEKSSAQLDITEVKIRAENNQTQSRRSLHFDYANFASTHGGLGRGHIKTLDDLFDDTNLDQKISLNELFNLVSAAGGREISGGGSRMRYVLENVTRDIEVAIPLHGHHRARSDSRDNMADYLTVLQFREFFKAVGITKYLGQYHKEQKAAELAVTKSMGSSANGTKIRKNGF